MDKNIKKKKKKFAGEKLQCPLHRQSSWYRIQLHHVIERIRENKRGDCSRSRRMYERFPESITGIPRCAHVYHDRILRRENGSGIRSSMVQGEVFFFFFSYKII